MFVLHRSVDIKRKHLLCLLGSQSVFYLQIWFTNLNLPSYIFTTFSLSPPTRPSIRSASLYPHTRLHKQIRQRFSAAHGQRAGDANITLCLGWESPIAKVTLPKLTQESTKLLYENTETLPPTCFYRKWGFRSLPLKCNR